MADTHEVLQRDGTVCEYAAEQFAEIRRVRTHAEHGELLQQGWLALDEEIEEGEAPEPRAAWKQALTETVTPPAEASQTVIYVLGRLKDGEGARRSSDGRLRPVPPRRA
jgi:hypothetical protein